MLTRPGLPPQPLLAASGALPAVVDLPGGAAADETSFITALGLRALRDRPGAARARTRMLDFLESCRVASPAGAFAYWPAAARPRWGQGVPPDADDTALCLLELHAAGRLAHADAVRLAARLLLPNRLRAAGPRPPWMPDGAVATWLVPKPDGRNIVDCAVNANVLALFAALGMHGGPVRAAAVRLILDGLAWAGRDPLRLRVLTPFYPELAEFRLAVAHAVACGVGELAPAARQLAILTGGAVPGADAVICAGAYARRGWRSPALAALRRGALPEASFPATRLP